MKYLLTFCILAFSLNATVYYAKVEPYATHSITASVSGEVVFLAKDTDGRVSNGEVLIQIDDFLNKKELKSAKIKLKSLTRVVELTQKNIKNSKKVEQIKEENYNKIKDLKTKSRASKDAELISLINATNQLLSFENSLENLKISISDLRFRIAVLEDSISKKSISVQKGFFIYKTHVSKGDFVNIGASLADAYDISYGKLTIFLSKEDVEIAQNSKIYINDKPSDLKIDNIWKIADTQNISAFRTEIIIPAPKRFSELLRIEFK